MTTIPDVPAFQLNWLRYPKRLSLHSRIFFVDLSPSKTDLYLEEMVLSFSTNPFNNYYAANSKEFISLDKAAKQDFKPENWYDLLPGNADSFAADLEKYAKHFGYGFLLNVPSMRTDDPVAANTFIYSK